MPKQRDLTSLVKAVGTVIREQLAKTLRPIVERLEGLEQRFSALPAPTAGKDGRNAYEVAVSLGYEGTVHQWMESLQGKAGEKCTPEEIAPLVQEAVSRAVAALPPAQKGEDGKSVTVEDLQPLCEQLVARAVGALPKPKDGESVTPEQVLPHLTAELQKAIAAIPLPKDGKGVSVEDFRPLFEAEQAKWALEFERRAADLIQRCIDRIPKPQDGRDGLQLEDFELLQSEDGRTITLALIRGEARVERSFTLSHPLYQGVWKDGAYHKGDCVTFGGSSWIATRATNSRPESDDSWRLAVKRGRDGKSAESKPRLAGVAS